MMEGLDECHSYLDRYNGLTAIISFPDTGCDATVAGHVRVRVGLGGHVYVADWVRRSSYRLRGSSLLAVNGTVVQRQSYAPPPINFIPDSATKSIYSVILEWFQPFERIQYSVGVIDVVIQNLPRSVRFKPENIIIVATIPGPKEPTCDDLNSYLECMVNDLLKLWEGVQLQTPSSILPSRTIRAVLGYISSDIPATRKICFYGVKVTYACSKRLKSFPSTSFSHTN